MIKEELNSIIQKGKHRPVKYRACIKKSSEATEDG